MNSENSDRDKFLSIVYKEVLDEMFKKTEDCKQNHSTKNSVIQNFKSTVQFYENMSAPYEKINLGNAIEDMSVGANGRRPKLCKVCGYNTPETSSTTIMNDHVRIKHMFQNPYVCSGCEKTFTRQVSLNEHIRNSHFKPPTASTLYVENAKTKRLSCVTYDGKELTSGMAQLYYVTWLKKKNHTEVMGISVDMTTCTDVKYAAKQLWDVNLRSAQFIIKNEENQRVRGCSYKYLIKDNDWFFDPNNAQPIPIYGKDEPAGKTLKWYVRIALDAECYQKPKSALIHCQNCVTHLKDAIRTILPELPKKNVQFFHNFDLNSKTFESEDEPSQKRPCP